MRRGYATLFLALLFVSGPAQPQTADEQAASVEDLAWMAGTWEGVYEGAVADEIWMPPRAGSMAGTFRSTGPGGVTQIFFMIIREEADGIVFRLSGVSPAFADLGRGPVAFRLVRLEGRTAVFDREPGSATTLARLIYDRKGPEDMLIRLEFDPTPPAGRKRVADYNMALAG